MDSITVGQAIEALSRATNETDIGVIVTAIISIISVVMHFLKSKHRS